MHPTIITSIPALSTSIVFADPAVAQKVIDPGAASAAAPPVSTSEIPAQTAAPTPIDAGDIVETARRTSEAWSRVPVAVTAFSPRELSESIGLETRRRGS